MQNKKCETKKSKLKLIPWARTYLNIVLVFQTNNMPAVMKSLISWLPPWTSITKPTSTANLFESLLF